MAPEDCWNANKSETWFCHVRNGPCLFIREDCVLVLCADDAILMARDDKALDKILGELREENYNFSRDGDFKS